MGALSKRIHWLFGVSFADCESGCHTNKVAFECLLLSSPSFHDLWLPRLNQAIYYTDAYVCNCHMIDVCATSTAAMICQLVFVDASNTLCVVRKEEERISEAVP